MKNIIMIIAFAVFSGTYSASAQEGKTTSKNEACCSTDKKVECKSDAKCTTAEKKSCETSKTHTCLADGSCCDTSKKSTKKSTKKA